MKGLLLVLIAVGLGAAYYSGAMSSFIAALTGSIATPGLRNVIPFPGAKKANNGGSGITDTGSRQRRVGGIAI